MGSAELKTRWSSLLTWTLWSTAILVKRILMRWPLWLAMTPLVASTHCLSKFCWSFTAATASYRFTRGDDAA